MNGFLDQRRDTRTAIRSYSLFLFEPFLRALFGRSQG
jgi:hypothetical protein